MFRCTTEQTNIQIPLWCITFVDAIGTACLCLTSDVSCQWYCWLICSDVSLKVITSEVSVSGMCSKYSFSSQHQDVSVNSTTGSINVNSITEGYNVNSSCSDVSVNGICQQHLLMITPCRIKIPVLYFWCNFLTSTEQIRQTKNHHCLKVKESSNDTSMSASDKKQWTVESKGISHQRNLGRYIIHVDMLDVNPISTPFSRTLDRYITHDITGTTTVRWKTFSIPIISTH